MTDVVMKVEGLKELEKALTELNEEFGGKSAPQAIRPAIRKAMAPLVPKLQAATPEDTGALKQSAKLSVRTPNKKMASQSEHYNNTTILAGQVGWFWKKPSLWSRALAVEYGTQDRAGKFILTQLFEQNNSEMLKTFKAELGPAIEKKAAQLHKKRLKGK